jgi:hypothetical protein
MNDQRVVEITVRIDRLERENHALRRRLRRFVYAVIACSFVLVAAGAMGQFQKAVEVYDAQNVMRCVLFADNNVNKSGLEIRDSHGHLKLAVQTNQNEDPIMSLYDEKGNTRIELGIKPNGEAYLCILSGNGTIVHSFVAPF